jgi:hypothetical protein
MCLKMQFVSRSKHVVSQLYKKNWLLMSCVELVTVCSGIHTEHLNKLCEHDVECLNFKHGGSYSNHCALGG